MCLGGNRCRGGDIYGNLVMVVFLMLKFFVNMGIRSSVISCREGIFLLGWSSIASEVTGLSGIPQGIIQL